MKTILTSITIMLLISFLAVGAFAQNEDPDQKKPENQTNQNETPKVPHNFENVPGLEGNGGIHRNDHSEEGGGPHGAVSDEEGDEKAYIDEDGDGFNDFQLRDRQGDLLGVMIRVENQLGTQVQQHGSLTDGSDDMLKDFGEDCDGTSTQDGSMENERQVHGAAGLIGPYDDTEGFGEASDQEVGTGVLDRSRGESRK